MIEKRCIKLEYRVLNTEIIIEFKDVEIAKYFCNYNKKCDYQIEVCNRRCCLWREDDEVIYL